MNEEFDTSIADSQGTAVKPLSSADFNIEEYCDYEASLLEGCNEFWKASEGVAVYRRFRVPEVYSWACADMKLSLELQLGALKNSMAYKADIPNFLEPWYGIGVAASPFGVPYIWQDGQAPAVEGVFKTAREAIDARQGTIAESPIGKQVLEMIGFFLEETKGKIPLSLTDTQSPLNIVSSYIMDSSSFMFELYDHPDDLKELLMLVAGMEKEFLDIQKSLIGDALVKPGHGFASAKCFNGVGFSDDNILMFSNDVYAEFALPPLLKAAEGFSGPVFHSCGDWSERAGYITQIPGLKMADGAVGNLTDPSPNDPEKLGKAFSGKDAVLHTRIVGNPDIVGRYLPHLRKDGLRTIIVTYCATPEEQAEAYNKIHEQ